MQLRSQRSTASLLAVLVVGTALVAQSSRGADAARSRDGEIAFSSDSNVYVVRGDGTATRRIGAGRFFDWAPDGRRLVLSRDGIRTVNTDGSRVQPVVDDADATEVAWSPTSDKILFSSDRDGDFDVYVVDADGTNLRNLTPWTSSEGGSAWSPDGRRIAFTRRRLQPARDELSVMNSDGTERRVIARGFAIQSPSWSPDGRTIAYQRQSPDKGDWEIYVTGVDGTEQRNLTARVALDAQDPTWSPGGNKLLFVCHEGCGANRIYLLTLAGAHRKLARGSQPSWSPDGDMIAYVCFRKRNYEICSMTGNGRSHRSLTDTRSTEGGPEWSPR